MRLKPPASNLTHPDVFPFSVTVFSKTDFSDLVQHLLEPWRAFYSFSNCSTFQQQKTGFDVENQRLFFSVALARSSCHFFEIRSSEDAFPERKANSKTPDNLQTGFTQSFNPFYQVFVAMKDSLLEWRQMFRCVFRRFWRDIKICTCTWGKIRQHRKLWFQQ